LFIPRRKEEMELSNDLKQTLKQLRLSGVLLTLLERAAYAKGVKLSYFEFMELVLRDEVDRSGITYSTDEFKGHG
jgi:hypothetical protein